jgi:hypothetical protein
MCEILHRIFPRRDSGHVFCLDSCGTLILGVLLAIEGILSVEAGYFRREGAIIEGHGELLQ